MTITPFYWSNRLNLTNFGEYFGQQNFLQFIEASLAGNEKYNEFNGRLHISAGFSLLKLFLPLILYFLLL